MDGEIPGWSLEGTLILGLPLIMLLYLFTIGPMRRSRRLGAPVERWRVAMFGGGLLILFLALASPLDGIGEEYLFSAHMLQHLVLMQIVAPMLLLGLPPWIMRTLPHNSAVWAISRALTQPVVTFLLSFLIFAIWHLPSFYEAALASVPVHYFQHLTIILAGILMWWPGISRVRALPRLSPPGRVLYYFLMPIPTSVLGALITFNGDIMYPTYAIAPRLWDISPRMDQELAGLIMWVPGKLVFWIALAFAFFQWIGKEGTSAEPAPQSEAG